LIPHNWKKLKIVARDSLYSLLLFSFFSWFIRKCLLNYFWTPFFSKVIAKLFLIFGSLLFAPYYIWIVEH
jgi:hypothetical protein